MSYPDPRYFGDQGEVSAKLRVAGAEPDLTIGSSTVMRYLATGASTNGRFGLYRFDMGPRTPGAAAHFHRTMSEVLLRRIGDGATIQRRALDRRHARRLSARARGRCARLSQQLARSGVDAHSFRPRRAA